MKRRGFITIVVGAAASRPLAALAQQPDRMRRIGWLDNAPADAPAAQERTTVVLRELEKSGWVVDRNLQVEHRWGVTSAEAAQRASSELLSLSPDVILCVGSPGVTALQQATMTVPIVFIQVAEPVDQGFVQNLTHPGGNITGFAYLERTVGAKWLALLAEIAPGAKHVGYVFSPKAAPYAHFYYETAEIAAAKQGVALDVDPVTAPTEFEPIFSKIGSAGGMILNADAFVTNNMNLIIDLASKYRVPAIYGGGNESFTKLGGLISYTADVLAQFSATAPYLDRILRGEKPADLPVQFPAKFKYSINLKTAKALGLSVPLTMQMTADEVIE